ncbi:YgaP family membrane protein [Halosimplex halobium]|uniref:YgaP family membrane protein n=1 Tax=Halosimplex halobium TaxID=3396618 RepID=UPI003F5670BD
MDSTQSDDGNGRIARALLAAGLGAAALWSLRKGKRLRGALAGLGAVALGYSATSDADGVTDPLAEEFEIGEGGESDDATSAGGDAEDGPLRCAACGEPIVAGQIRVPNEDDETVHETCLEATA